jgi:hypothetical protein
MDTAQPMDAFFEFAVEIADGERWKVLRADGWGDFERRLAETVADLPVRRRQALIMLLFGLVEELVTPDDVREWTLGHDVSSDDGVEALISWLRQRRAGFAR